MRACARRCTGTDVCAQCPLGKYSRIAGGTVCLDCELGTANSYLGRPSVRRKKSDPACRQYRSCPFCFNNTFHFLLLETCYFSASNALPVATRPQLRFPRASPARAAATRPLWDRPSACKHTCNIAIRISSHSITHTLSLSRCTENHTTESLILRNACFLFVALRCAAQRLPRGHVCRRGGHELVRGVRLRALPERHGHLLLPPLPARLFHRHRRRHRVQGKQLD